MNDRPSTTSPTTIVYWAAAIITFAAVAMGSLVCATDSSSACPNWPGCYVGQVMPEGAASPLIEFVHRVVAVSTGPLLLAAAVLGLRLRRHTPAGRRIDPVVQVLPWLALAGALAAGVFGMMTIKWGLTTGQAATDLGAALAAMVLMTLAAVARTRTPGLLRLTTTAQFAWGAVVAFWLVHITGVFAAGPGSLTRCVSCPVWGIVEQDGPVWLQVTRMVLAAAGIILVVAAVVTGLRERTVRWTALAVSVLLIVELAVGLVILQQGTTYLLSSVYAVTMVALLWTTTLLAARSTVTRLPVDGAGSVEVEREPAHRA